MMEWAVGWPLLILSFLLPEPFKEQLLAAQTVLCVVARQRQPFHLITFLCVISYFTQTQEPLLASLNVHLLHHSIVLCTIFVQYLEQKYQLFCWTLLLWSTRWLGSVNLFSQGVRSLMKCLLLTCVLQGKWRREDTLQNELKWCWILFVHESTWCLLPVQMLYEVYAVAVHLGDEVV